MKGRETVEQTSREPENNILKKQKKDTYIQARRTEIAEYRKNKK